MGLRSPMQPNPSASSTKPKTRTPNRELKGKAPMASGGAQAKFPLTPKSHLLKWKKSKGAGPSKLGCPRLGLGSSHLGQPEGSWALSGLPTVGAGSLPPSGEACAASPGWCLSQHLALLVLFHGCKLNISDVTMSN